MSHPNQHVTANPNSPLPIVVAVSGGSGAVYTRRLLQVLANSGHKVHLLLSNAGSQVIQQELGLRLNLNAPDLHAWLGLDSQAASQIHFHQLHDFFTPVASGSYRTAGMVICPCSGGTLSAVAHGTSSNLIHRAAEVHLKERRKLILVPRETPISHVALKNMLAVHEAGAVVMPASPGWYHGVQSLDDLVDFMVARILDQLNIDNDIIRRWGST
ncbi:MAG: UbiX family flavin prenyltransferase [Planctomycetaceae bacterium]|nr:UbiX family flavin prenyltransferase [Planctomycetaceae bacterium]